MWGRRIKRTERSSICTRCILHRTTDPALPKRRLRRSDDCTVRVSGFAKCIAAAERSEMASPKITPLQLELSEGPTELVQLYVGFNRPGGDLVKGKVLAWEGPDSGYTVTS